VSSDACSSLTVVPPRRNNRVFALTSDACGAGSAGAAAVLSWAAASRFANVHAT